MRHIERAPNWTSVRIGSIRVEYLLVESPIEIVHAVVECDRHQLWYVVRLQSARYRRTATIAIGQATFLSRTMFGLLGIMLALFGFWLSLSVGVGS